MSINERQFKSMSTNDIKMKEEKKEREREREEIEILSKASQVADHFFTEPFDESRFQRRVSRSYAMESIGEILDRFLTQFTPGSF